ncbi:adenylosuccinate synthetase [Lapidilactobacillus concavus DSM 17758]|uniref:Adenylosuccinate synthetase n=1 Tax=Lapidilactobacillus concavus DSM 17758 TaxID=1423735 RepID=A0A0R1W7K4_9LACO|nr:adenylosuccinate synthase [Lapidilactobacillus concavus]KRM13896.1 adenylosuccinate synthetase [Lapidilactobacillus concavus DSM 17758]GEL13144.1 adenylosuccinate synthetase [Lapidilactobacillus concavus]
MSGTVVVGTQWGDEGKGKITDFLSQKADIITRYQGGDNAGHTIKLDDKTYKLRSIPSGILYADKTCVLGNGVVLNPKSLVEEISRVQSQGLSTDNLVISDRAHLILPYHIALDKAEENYRQDEKIGTTNRGIGPAYMDKADRSGIRMVDLLDKDIFAKKLAANLKFKNELLTKIYGAEPLDFDSIFEPFYEYGQQLKPYVMDTSYLLNQEFENGKNLLFEGAQGIMLDLDHGTYPFVTSSNPAGGVSAGAGIGPKMIDHVVGVAKAYTSRVGAGPFPTEQLNEIGDYIREAGHEFGVVTKRPRRIGWFDAVVVNHSKRVAGVTELCLNSIDVLTGLKTVKICTAYRLNGQLIKNYPASLSDIAKCEPVYEELPGWDEDITEAQKLSDLPENAQNYLKRISELVELPYATFSVGPDREQTIVLNHVWH